MNIEIETLEEKQLSDKNASKLILSEEVISYFSSLFSEEIEEREKRYEESKNDYYEIKEKVSNSKKELEKLNSEFEKQKLVSATLEKIDTLRKYDLLYGSNKRVVNEIIDSIDSCSVKDLKSYKQKLQSLIEKSLKK